MEINEEQALAEMLLQDIVFLNADNGNRICVYVLCNDLFDKHW